MNLQTAIAQFLLARAADGLKGTTLNWYHSLLTVFSEVSGANRTLTQFTSTDLRKYIVHIRGRDYTEDTIHAHIRVLHTFWRWCAKEYRFPNPMDSIGYPKQPSPKMPKAIEPADVIKLLATCEETDIGIRDKAIIAFLIDTGCRAAGLCGLMMDALDMYRLKAYVIEKGSKRRALMFTETTAWLLWRWLTVRNKDEPTVFHSTRGGILKPNGLYQMTERRKKRAGVERANPHSFRHGFAVEYILDGGDLGTLSRILGHEDVQTTSRFYAVFVEDELKRMHDEHTPMRKIKSVSQIT